MRSRDSLALRGFPRSWFCRVVAAYGGDLNDLNAQLALAPKPGHSFKLNRCPQPYYPKTAAPALFDRALAGKNPDNWEWVDLGVEGNKGRFNLFLRAATHLPGSEDWLFRGLHPYLRATVPPIEHAFDLLEVCLKRLGLCVLPEPALETVLRLDPDRGQHLSRRAIDCLVEAAEPIHLMTLFALWHLAHWQRPYSAAAEDLHLASCAGLRRFLMRPEFGSNEMTCAAAKFVEHALWEVKFAIKHDGFRVPRPNSGYERVGFPPLLIRNFEYRDAAIACAGLGSAVPIEHFIRAEPAPFRKDAIPTGDELAAVTSLLLQAGELTLQDLRSYTRDPAVLRELAAPQKLLCSARRKKKTV